MAIENVAALMSGSIAASENSGKHRHVEMILIASAMAKMAKANGALEQQREGRNRK